MPSVVVPAALPRASVIDAAGLPVVARALVMEVGGGLPAALRASVIEDVAGREPVVGIRVACGWGEFSATFGFSVGFAARGENESACRRDAAADGVEVVAGFGVVALAAGFEVVALFSVFAAGCFGAPAAGCAAGFGAGGGGGEGVTGFFDAEMAIAEPRVRSGESGTHLYGGSWKLVTRAVGENNP